MAESLALTPQATKEERYKELLPQIKAVIEVEEDLVANLANISAMLKEAFDFFWVGFYINKEDELVLGPFQGPLACTRISFEKGVCGAVASQQRTIVVPDVNRFPGHIACSSASKSEIVVPLVVGGHTKMVLDVDSDLLDDFDETDAKYLEEVMDVVKSIHFPI
ncbi:MAG: GAF domain-containing protein [Bacteroidia bacterium]|nr:GAF domain-containing protein [Bacteroidia bacterium]